VKRAVIVGINDYPGEANDLGGCVNDALAWRDVLEDLFAFGTSQVRMLLDAEATRKGILNALESLVAVTGDGDVAAFIYSGHGTWVPETGSKDEADRRDEALVPFEADFRRLILDDDLRPMLDNISSGASFTFIADSCHSGTVTRIYPEGRVGERARFFPPPQHIARRTELSRAPLHRLIGRPEEEMREMLLTAASPDEPAAEDDFDGVRRGVFSYFAIKALREAGPDITYARWLELIRASIFDAGFSQSPQLEGPSRLKTRRVFS